MRITERELWAFISRADTKEKCDIAEKWIKEHVDSNELYNELMMALAYTYREIDHIERGY